MYTRLRESEHRLLHVQAGGAYLDHVKSCKVRFSLLSDFLSPSRTQLGLNGFQNAYWCHMQSLVMIKQTGATICADQVYLGQPVQPNSVCTSS